MTKIEELRDALIEAVADGYWHNNVNNHVEEAVKDVDSLIAAVREDEREKCANYMLWRRDELEEAAGIDPKEGQHD